MPKSTAGTKITRWTPEEWEALARELHRQHPLVQYPHSEDLSGLIRQDFMDAQSVLPLERRRDNSKIPTLTPVRIKLLPHLHKIRAEEEAKAKQPPPAPTVSKVFHLPQEQTKLPQETNPYEAVFGPLIEFVAEEVARKTEQRLMVMLAKLNLIPDTISEFTPEGRRNPKAVPRPRIGIVGPLGVQQMEIRRAFPEVDFVMETDSMAVRAEAFHTCDKIIGMTDFMRHSADGLLREKYGDKYARTTGSTSSVKRLIGLVLHGLKPHTPKPNLSAHH